VHVRDFLCSDSRDQSFSLGSADGLGDERAAADCKSCGHSSEDSVCLLDKVGRRQDLIAINL
jgi:hypothetical protein